MTPLTEFIGASIGTNALAVVVTVVSLRTDIKWIKSALKRTDNDMDTLRKEIHATEQKAEAAHRRLDVYEARQQACNGPT